MLLIPVLDYNLEIRCLNLLLLIYCSIGMGKKKFGFLLGVLEALILLLFSLKKVYVFVCLCWVSRFVLSYAGNSFFGTRLFEGSKT